MPAYSSHQLPTLRDLREMPLDTLEALQTNAQRAIDEYNNQAVVTVYVIQDQGYHEQYATYSLTDAMQRLASNLDRMAFPYPEQGEWIGVHISQKKMNNQDAESLVRAYQEE